MSQDPIRIILLLMVKNESRIITRSILSALPVVDAVCVSDTGSTDGTPQILDALYPTLSVSSEEGMRRIPCKTPASDPGSEEGMLQRTHRVPCKTYDHPWTNFGVNRTKSFHDAKQFCHELGWNPSRTYALALDADMELVAEPSFDKQALLGLKGYSLTQKAGALHYINARLLRIDVMWTCKGATHEYWDGPMESVIPASTLWINDRNDGGCKADKYTRDRALLEQELIEDPSGQRTHFYLAQTYKCLGLHDLTIDTYKKRIALGGWYEEVWYSHYMIAEQYLALGNPIEAEHWVLKAQAYHGYRAEALYLLVKHFRIQSQHWKAMHYYHEAKRVQKPAVALFLQSDVYDHLLDYEYTVLQFYVNPERREGLRASIAYMLKPQSLPLFDNVFSNALFYVEPLRSQETYPLNLPIAGPYAPSSVSVIIHDGAPPALNVRYVNYSVSDQGGYKARDIDNIVRTQNMYVPSAAALLGRTDPSSQSFVIDDPALATHPVNIMGLEDVRLFSQNGTLVYTATSKSCTADGRYRMVMGIYDPSANQFRDSRILEPPTPTDCEKNWLMVPRVAKAVADVVADVVAKQQPEQPEPQSPPLFVYKWHPFEAGTVATDNRLTITTRYETPPYFMMMRGSANGILVNGRIWCLTHVVKYGTPRRYYHHIVILNKDTLKPEEISTPFYFQTLGIEYCLGIHLNGAKDGLVLYVSTFDADPKVVMVPLTAFEFLQI